MESGRNMTTQEQVLSKEWGFSALPLLPASAAPKWTVRPYIHRGYRDVMAVGECVGSLLYLHNETGNVWTHVVGVAVFVALGMQDWSDSSMEQHHRVVAAVYCGATTLCMGFSAAFHLMQPNSKRTYDLMLKLDMSGIAIVIIASIQIGLHYGFWCHQGLQTMYTVVTGGLSCVAIVWPHVPALLNNYRATVAFFASFVGLSLLPLFHWVSIVGGFQSPQAVLFFYKLLGTFLLYAFGFWWYITALPESRFGGRFDFFLSSHQLWHMGVLAGSLLFYSAMKSYAFYRASTTCLAP
mmetsp:Transcript_55982/g.128096  ORF Transcript_55982/g.128096 Transcript_55982/m.128096 type:complete len:295 (+) Transcript_55982:44-928(+)